MQIGVAVDAAKVREVETVLRFSRRNKSVVPVIGQNSDDVLFAIAVYDIGDIHNKRQVAAILSVVSVFTASQFCKRALQMGSVDPYISNAHDAFKLEVEFFAGIGFVQVEVLAVHRFSLVVFSSARVVLFETDGVRQINVFPAFEFCLVIVSFNSFRNVLTDELPALVEIQFSRPSVAVICSIVCDASSFAATVWVCPGSSMLMESSTISKDRLHCLSFLIFLLYFSFHFSFQTNFYLVVGGRLIHACLELSLIHI